MNSEKEGKKKMNPQAATEAEYTPVPAAEEAPKAPWEGDLSGKGVEELRSIARTRFGSGVWISIARKEALLKAIKTGIRPSPDGMGPQQASPTPAPAAQGDLATLLAQAVAKHLPQGGRSTEELEALVDRMSGELGTLRGDMDFVNETMPKVLAKFQEQEEKVKAALSEVWDRLKSAATGAPEGLLAAAEKKWAEMSGKLVNELNARFVSQLDYAKAGLDRVTDDRINAKLDALGETLTLKIQKRLIKEVVVKKWDGTKVPAGAQHKSFPLLLQVLSCKLNAYLVGPAGSGKTKGAEEAAKALGLAFYPQSVGAQTSMAQLFGYMDAGGKYVRTVFRDAFEKGGVFLLDEIDAANANVLTAMNAALGNGYCSFPDQVVQAHPDFLCVAAANTWGHGADRQYVGRNALDAATLNRFVSITWDYDEDLERLLSGNLEWSRRVQAIRAAVFNDKVRLVISPRASIYGARLLTSGMKRWQVEELLIWGGVDKATRKKLESQLPKDPVQVDVEMEGDTPSLPPPDAKRRLTDAELSALSPEEYTKYMNEREGL